MDKKKKFKKKTVIEARIFVQCFSLKFYCSYMTLVRNPVYATDE